MMTLLFQDQVMSPWQTCSLFDTENCNTRHEPVKYTGTVNILSGRSPAILNAMPFSHNSARVAESPTKTKRPFLSKGSESKIKQNSDDSPLKISKTRSAPDYFKKDISYPFSHGEIHLGHIKQYR